ncbi:MAG TPA: amidase [Acidimicrobiia bacterium]|nr:amidase [Acidimicrobiia bacterium]HIL06032.1 amidase [Acidimicrobiia bacterium]
MSHDEEVSTHRHVKQQLDRISKRDGTVRAWVHRHDDETILSALATAPRGPLSGWTLGVKDVIDTFDLPTERGSPIYAGRTTLNDAACVALAREAGAVVMGKTVTTEFALFTPNVTTNPHNSAHTPGGSSSGSAAAVADGQVRAAFGTQTVGSVVRPAAYCGVVGFKPTHQLVPLTGVATLSHAFDTVGWFTQGVDDAATMFSALTGTAVLTTEQPLRIGRYRSHQWDAATSETVAVMDSACDALCQRSTEVVELDPLPHLESVFEAANTILHYEIVRVFAWEQTHHYELISDLARKMLVRAKDVTHEQYTAAHLTLIAARREHDEFMAVNAFDALLTPSTPGEAPLIKTTGDSVFNRVWTALGVPAIHLPLAMGPTGLPLGVQLTGRSWRDGDLLASAALGEAAFNGAT